MAGRRQVWAGLTLFAVSVGLWAVAAGLVEPLSPFEAATLAATSMLVSLWATRSISLPLALNLANPIEAAGAAPAMLIWSCDPGTPGRPRPRAPSCVAAARAA
jgi:Family of unknown function (DUF6412)